MARNIHWTIPFNNINSVSCRVDIYEEGYEGEVKTLIASSTPFFYEESDDTNLLQTFIRFKTGYIGVIEEVYGELDALYALTDTSRYIMAWYGSKCIFSGYIQAEQPENAWEACPREIQLSVLSPLALAEAKEFNIQPPTRKTLGELLNIVASNLNPQYTTVVYPKLKDRSGADVNPWSLTLASLAVCPFNDNFFHTDKEADLYKGNTYKYFLEGICKMFRWQLHETFNTLYFTDILCNNGYVSSPLDALTSITPISVNTKDLLTYYEHTDDESTFKSVRPVRSIEVSQEDSEPWSEFSFIRSRNQGLSNFCLFLYPATDEISSPLMRTEDNPQGYADNDFTKYGACGLNYTGYGKNTDVFVIACNKTWTNKLIATFKCYNPSVGDFSFAAQFGLCLADLRQLDTYDYNVDINMKVSIKNSNGKYWNSSTQQKWQSTEYLKNYPVSKDFPTMYLNVPQMPDCDYVEINIYLTSCPDPAPTSATKPKITISNAKYTVGKEENSSNKYTEREYETISSDNYSPDKEELTESINFTHSNALSVYGNKNIVRNNFEYMFSALTIFKGAFQSKIEDTNIYSDKYKFWNNKEWHMLAHSFDMSEDETTLTLIHTDALTSKSVTSINLSCDEEPCDIQIGSTTYHCLFQATDQQGYEVRATALPSDATEDKGVYWSYNDTSGIMSLQQHDDYVVIYVNRLPETPMVVKLRATLKTNSSVYTEAYICIGE